MLYNFQYTGKIENVEKKYGEFKYAVTVKYEVCGKKGFKQFSKKHICIAITYQIREKKFIISNYPRLPDGSYGSEKGSISEMFSVAYESSKDAALIQENFLKAYRDAEAYLEKIGSEL